MLATAARPCKTKKRWQSQRGCRQVARRFQACANRLPNVCSAYNNEKLIASWHHFISSVQSVHIREPQKDSGAKTYSRNNFRSSDACLRWGITAVAQKWFHPFRHILLKFNFDRGTGANQSPTSRRSVATSLRRVADWLPTGCRSH